MLGLRTVAPEEGDQPSEALRGQGLTTRWRERHQTHSSSAWPRASRNVVIVKGFCKWATAPTPKLNVR
jgi:hypothetical protein